MLQDTHPKLQPNRMSERALEEPSTSSSMSSPLYPTGRLVFDSSSNHYYSLHRGIGRGGFGRVFEASDNAERRVALKIVDLNPLDQAKRARVEEEIRVHRRVTQQLPNHPNLLQLNHAFRFQEHLVVLQLELCERGDLEEVLQQQPQRRLQESAAADVFRQIATGIKALHQMGILHRDLKLANIFVNKKGQCKIGDFGLAVSMNEGSHENDDYDDEYDVADDGMGVLGVGNNARRTFCGTPVAMAPEIVKRAGHGFPADIWALGVILYTLTVGKSPFEAANRDKTMKKALHETPNLPDHLSPLLIDLVSSMLQKDEKRRPTIQQVLEHPFLNGTRMTVGSSGTKSWNGDSGIGCVSSMSTSVSRTSSTPLSNSRSAPLIKPSLAPIVELRGRQLSSMRLDSPSASNVLLRPTGSSDRAPPLNTLRLKASRTPHLLRSGVNVAILESGEVKGSFEIRKRATGAISKVQHMIVSGDGHVIRLTKASKIRDADDDEQVYERHNENVVVYKYDSLPASLWQKYNLLARQVELCKEMTAKLTLQFLEAECRLMENLPEANFEVHFREQNNGYKRVIYSAKDKKVECDDESSFHLNDLSIRCQMLSDEKARCLQLFASCHKRCRRLEALLRAEEESSSLSLFPAFMGSKKTSFFGSEQKVITAPAAPSLLDFMTTSALFTKSPDHPANERGLKKNASPVSLGGLGDVHRERTDSNQNFEGFLFRQARQKDDGQGAYLVCPFDDGSELHVPSHEAVNSGLKFKYRNIDGSWETAKGNELTFEMRCKFDVVKEANKHRQQLRRRNHFSS